ncbi:NrfD/PsrC family molybdoenzyme membrane anchor subunit [Pyrobaculum calidifontis]|uniref:Respiratory nitrite reductase specific menaquinol--cytochrome-c reductase complex subunit NrfD n=1 Tax=Pyrobaculum calidifontis (strain DSM 21063 / JCM 11548 / VA1) TaxID=410359 RepID=A3MW96_PYRCJ|nr:NrfD/PsrC family molybdoenzyme membrane anchor subunit [Pyrobaculum calidifontis]ABO08913.1 respiratory nitrite reductase specific menaquinol--cytochrome-c reductase complex subunit NrfD [Pyrobaculum calidifontis JCM 11548]
MFQEYWDAFLIGPFLFFAGLVGMGMVAMSIFKLRGEELRYETLTYVLLASIILALLFVMGDLSRPPTVMMFAMLNSFLELRYNFLFPFLRGELRFSWMALGIVMLILALLVVAIWALPYLVRRIQAALPQPLAKPLAPLLALLDKIATWLLAQRWYYYLAMAIGVLVTLYSGFLISEAKAVPFWNTTLWGIPGIPTIWIFSATAGALALIRMYHLDREHLVHTTEKYGVLFEIGEVAVIFLFLYNALNSASFAARESAHAVLWGELAPIFWVFVIGLGIVTPLATAALSKIRHSPKLTYAGCVAGLFGALALRTLVVYAGIPEPL